MFLGMDHNIHFHLGMAFFQFRLGKDFLCTQNKTNLKLRNHSECGTSSPSLMVFFL